MLEKYDTLDLACVGRSDAGRDALSCDIIRQGWFAVFITGHLKSHMIRCYTRICKSLYTLRVLIRAAKRRKGRRWNGQASWEGGIPYSAMMAIDWNRVPGVAEGLVNFPGIITLLPFCF
jgi:hypothetical protein